MRISGGSVELPAYTYQHPVTGNQLELVPLNHYGSTGYYDQIRTETDAFYTQGGAVHYESIGTEPAPGLDPGLDALTRQLLEARELGGATFKAMGLTAQRQYLKWGEGWQNHDMPAHEIADMLGKRGVNALHRRARFTAMIAEAHVNKHGPEMAAKRLKATMLPRMAADKSETKPIQRWRAVKRRVRDILLHERNRRQLAAVDTAVQTNPGQPIRLLWGEGHVIGLRQGAEQRGYTLTSERWLEWFLTE